MIFFQMYTKTNKISSIFTHYMITLTVLGIIGFNIIAMYNNYNSGVFSNKALSNATYEFSIYYKYPFLDSKKYFIFFTIYNYYLTFNCATIVCSMDTYLILMMFQVIGHLYALKYSLINMSHDNNDTQEEKKDKDSSIYSPKLYNEDEDNKVHKELKANIDHHLLIVK